MTSQGSHLSPIKSININACIFRTSHNISIDKVNAEDRILMICFYPFYSVQFDILTPLSDASLLSWTDEIEFFSSLYFSTSPHISCSFI